jgi:hypothetical protein
MTVLMLHLVMIMELVIMILILLVHLVMLVFLAHRVVQEIAVMTTEESVQIIVALAKYI